MAGRPKTPIAIHRIRGTYREDRHGGTPEATGEPIAPDFLDDAAAAEFIRVVDELREMGTLASADAATIAAHAITFAKWREAERQIRETGIIIRTNTGEARVSPWQRIASECIQTLHVLANDLGLSPAARAKVTAKAPKVLPQNDKWRGLLAGGE